MEWNDKSIALKKSVINSGQLVFTASADLAAYREGRRRLIEAGLNSRLVDCSDAHAFRDWDSKDRIGNCMTWRFSSTSLSVAAWETPRCGFRWRWMAGAWSSDSMRQLGWPLATGWLSANAPLMVRVRRVEWETSSGTSARNWTVAGSTRRCRPSGGCDPWIWRSSADPGRGSRVW